MMLCDVDVAALLGVNEMQTLANISSASVVQKQVDINNGSLLRMR